MAWHTRLVGGVRGLFRTRQIDRELDDEVQGYLESAIAQKMQAGLTRGDATRAARLEFGSLDAVKERVRDVGWESLVDAFWQDARYATRRLRASPGFAAVAIFTLALGIGANTAIVSLANGLLLRAVPGANLDRVASVSKTSKGVPQIFRGVTGDEYRAIEASRLTSVETLFVSDPLIGALSVPGRSEIVTGEVVSGDYFQALGIRPRSGRLLGRADDRDAGDGTAIVISERLWRHWFGASPSAVGTVVTMAGHPLTVVGVAPEAFLGTWLPTMMAADFWVPAAAADRLRTVQGTPVNGPHRTFAQLKPGVALSQVDAAISTIGRAVHTDDPDVGLTAIPAERAILFDDFAKPGLLISAAVVAVSSLVFLIACANLTNLLLARAMTRAGEIATRLALGASRARVLRLLLMEAVLLTAVAGVVGLLLAVATTQLMLRVTLPQLDGITIRFDPSPDWRVFGYALTVATVAAFVIGLLPAWRASRTDPMQVMAANGQGGTESRRGQRLRAMIVAAQVAMSTILLLLAGLYVRSAIEARRFDPGFDTSHGAMASVNMALHKFDETRGRTLQRRMLDAAARIPGVARAVLASGLGATGAAQTTGTLLPEGQSPDAHGRGSVARYTEVSPGFFEALRIPLRRGRDFSEGDVAGSPPVGIVSETVAAKFWPGQDPIGRRFSLTPGGPLITVAGVSAPIAMGLRRSALDLFLYLPVEQNYSPKMSVVVTTTGNPAALIEPLRQAIRSADPELAVIEARTIADSVSVVLAPVRVAALVLGALGILGFAIAVLGIYGVMAYFVSRRTREFGIRRALGATTHGIYAVVVRSGLRMLMAGIVVGLPVAFIAAGFLEHLLYGITPHDPLTFIAIPLSLAIVGVAASALAARRAARVQPSEALRSL